MLPDFDLVIWEFERKFDHLNIYPLGDLHIGSPEFNADRWLAWKKQVMADPFAAVVIVGDMIDNGLKTSKTDSYSATMSPFEQKERLYTELVGIKDKILAAVPGNHENRSTLDSDSRPLYDVMRRLGLAHLYRENVCFVKVSLGNKNKDRQFTYTICLHHGATKAKKDKFQLAIDGLDIMVTGHTHKPADEPFSKIVIDARNNKVTQKPVTSVVVNSNLFYGGYGVRSMYLPNECTDIQRIIISGKDNKYVGYERKPIEMLGV